jgi:hypothetical protein
MLVQHIIQIIVRMIFPNLKAAFIPSANLSILPQRFVFRALIALSSVIFVGDRTSLTLARAIFAQRSTSPVIAPTIFARDRTP